MAAGGWRSHLRLLDWRARWRRAATFLYFLGLNWLLLAPAEEFEKVEEFIPHQDKFAHAGVFLLLGFLVRWSLAARAGVDRRLYVAVAALLAYAGAIEALQPVLGGAGRQFDWLDMAANIVGVLCGWLAYGRVAGYEAATRV